MGLKKIEKAEWKGEKFELHFDDEGDAVIEVGDESFYICKGARAEVEELEEILEQVRKGFGIGRRKPGELVIEDADQHLYIALKAWVAKETCEGHHMYRPTYGQRLKLPAKVVELLRLSEILP